MLRAAAETDGLAKLEENLKNVRVYLGQSDESGGYLKNLHIFTIPDPKDPDSKEVYVHAMSALAKADPDKKEFSFRLFDAYFETTEKPNSPHDEKPPAEAKPEGKAKANQPASTQQKAKPIAKVPPAVTAKPQEEAGTDDEDEDGKIKMIVAQEAVPVVISFDSLPQQSKPSAMTNADIEAFVKSKPKMEQRYRIGRYWAEVQRRYASSFACLAFAFIGIPLGIKARRKDTSTGLVLSLLIGVAYFVSGVAGGSTKAAIIAGVWGPNVACVIIGLFLLRRARFR
jgi:lipopolysaccharide export system permease protein